MAPKENYYDQLILKIDQFTRKYYMNQLIRGSLYFVGLLTLVFLAYNFLESQFYFSKSVRAILSFSYLGLFMAGLVFWILTPLFHYFRLGKLISHEEAAKIIGSQFKDVKDKLLNVLQLKSQSINFSDRSLIEASIAQKSYDLQPVPFVQAIDLQKNRKYMHYAIGPVFLLASILVFAPGFIQKPTQRLLQLDKDFEKEAAFKFVLDVPDLKVEQNGEFTLRLHTEGRAIPAEAFIEVDNFQYRLQKEGPEQFVYTFSNVQKDQTFKIFSGNVQSDEFLLQVLMKPLVEQFEVSLTYPAYTGRKPEKIENIGDLLIPTGTKVSWEIHTSFTDQLSFKTESDQHISALELQNENQFRYTRKFSKNESYTLYLKNQQLPDPDSVTYQIHIIEDQYPQIKVESFADSSNWKVQYFAGDASDDYGIKTLTFNYTILQKDGKEKLIKSVPIQTTSEAKLQDFRYVFDANNFNLEPGESISYYFEVWDNDAVNGSKSARSQIQLYKEASEEELAKQEASNNQDIKDNLEDALKDIKKLQERIDAFKNKMRQKKDLEWQHKKEIEKLMQDQQKLQNKLDEARKKFDENLKKQTNEDEKLQEKQEQLQKLFNETASEEMKQIMKQIQDLMSELNKEQTLKMTEQFQNKNMDMSKEMERLLELFKQLELEKNLKDQINELRKLSDKQDALSEQTQKEEAKEDGLKDQQEDINKKFDDLAKKQEEMQKKNEEMKSQRKMEDRKAQSEDIKKDLKGASEEMKNKDAGKSGKSKAAKKQKDASKKMKEMADQMEQEMEESDQEQAEEDAKMLRQLLENLVALSFEQEGLVKEFGQVNVQTPKFLGLVQDQFRIKENFKIVEDTLEVLSKRIVEIQSFVQDKVNEINANFVSGIDHLEERRSAEAGNNQRRVMTNMNDLALMLSETLNQKQKECKGGSCKKPGNKSCDKPGQSSGRKPADKITEGMKKMGQGMKDQLGKMKEGKQGTSQEFAEMAAQQAKLRKMLQDLDKENSERGNGSKEAREAIEEMNKLEKQLVNKQLTNEMLKRQEEITTRLLESDRAEREREWDEQRKSETGTNIERKFPPGLEEYIKQRQGETEWFKQISPELRPFYKRLVEQYYQSLKKQG
ncbi:MAG: DUF4175 domain-containing protein [Saprospiraceae bacterium]|nr:DUF4175 domain-containing protein [Saprospiraceae bacterium]